MTNQEIFDTILSHLRTQKYSCMDDGFCRYYDPETGRKCAVGCLIPAPLYSSDMDGDLCDTSITNNRLVQSVLKTVGVDLKLSLNLLDDMQKIHDWMYSREWGEYQEKQCLGVATRYNLIYTPA